MIKSSDYNLYFQYGDYYYIFNTWKGNLIEVTESEFSAFKDNNISELTNPNFTKMGFVTNLENEFSQICKENIMMNKYNSKFSIVIEPTFKCNAKCPYCFENGILSNQELDANTALKICDFIENNYNGRDIHITWFGGEPLMNPSMISFICEELSNRNLKFYSTMVSNGYLLNKYIDLFKKRNLKRVQVTIDGLFDKYNKIKKMGDNAFDVVINNIHLCLKNSFDISIRVNFDSENYSEYKNIIKYIYNEFGNNVTLYFHDIIGENYKTPLEVAKNPLIDIYSELFRYGYIKNLRDLRIRRVPSGCAINKFDYINVGPNGIATKCEHYVGKKSEFSIGNINDNTFNPNLHFPAITKFCNECICFPLCGGGCLANHKIRINAGCSRIKNCIVDLLKLYISETRKEGKQ